MTATATFNKGDAYRRGRRVARHLIQTEGPDRLQALVVDLDTKALDEVEEQLPTRNAAIQVALTPYVVRGGNDVWRVYDRANRSWPGAVSGRIIASGTDRAEVEKDADWLNRRHA